jgi:hypothetical protein
MNRYYKGADNKMQKNENSSIIGSRKILQVSYFLASENFYSSGEKAAKASRLPLATSAWALIGV